MSKTITARHLHTDAGTIEYPVIDIASDGTISGISSDPSALASDTTTLTAAFLDVHIHGGRGHDVMTASPAQLSELEHFLASHGVAHYLPTTVTAPIDATLRALEALADEISEESCTDSACPVGIHLEGPFLSHEKRGVHSPEMLQPPTIELFDRFYQASRGHIRLMTIAPEVPGALELIAHAASKGVKISLGHSNATAAQTLAGIAAGATTATHTFNAMRALDHREPGILGTVLTDDRLFADLICDGIHVAPAMVALWLRAKGYDRAMLITDAMAATGMPDGDYALGTLTATVANGKALLKDDLARNKETLAGSILTMDTAVENLQRFTNAGTAVAARLASHNPATMLGRPELTRLAPGSPANLNRFDANGRLTATYLHGRQI